MRSTRVQSFAAGVLVANSAPHIATAVTGRRHLTPLRGKDSGPGVNAVWAMLNIAAGAALLRLARRRGTASWGRDLLAFEAGYLAFASWMAGSERVTRINSAETG
jgi:hypothetical protein